MYKTRDSLRNWWPVTKNHIYTYRTVSYTSIHV